MDYSLESDFVKQLDQDILEFIHRGLEGGDEKRFVELALREFELQYHTIEPYREYCKNKGVSPKSATAWEQIPAIPSLAFKEFVLTSFPVEKAEHAYFTSGTTDYKKKGKIYRDKGAVRLVTEANGLLTRLYLFPDVEKMKILLMVPSPKMAPGMGMSVGLEQVRLKFGTPDTAYLLSPLGLDVKTLLGSLKQSEDSGRPIALVGATSGFVYFFNACEKENIRFKLPKGSRICDGGGYMDQFGDCSKEKYFEKCYEIMGVDERFCINVLGMGETSTNYFDNVLRNHLSGVKKTRCKEVPPWTRTIIVDTKDFKRVPMGEIGLLRHYDLTNRAMVFAVQTDNIGFETEDGFEIIGRWNKELGEIKIGGPVGHPGGKVVTQMMDYLMRRRLSKIGKIYAGLK